MKQAKQSKASLVSALISGTPTWEPSFPPPWALGDGLPEDGVEALDLRLQEDVPVPQALGAGGLAAQPADGIEMSDGCCHTDL